MNFNEQQWVENTGKQKHYLVGTIVKLRLPTVNLNRPPARPLFLHILSSLHILLWQSYTHKSYIPLFSNPSLLKMTGRLKQSFQTRYHVIFKKEGYQVYKDVPGSSCPVLNVSGILSKSFSLIRFTVCLYGQGEGVVGAVMLSLLFLHLSPGASVRFEEKNLWRN